MAPRKYKSIPSTVHILNELLHGINVMLPTKLTHSIIKEKLNGGEGGIRTRGTLRYTRFPIVHLRPLGHPSWEAPPPEAAGVSEGTTRRWAMGAHPLGVPDAPPRGRDARLFDL